MAIQDRQLERQGQRLGRAGGFWLAVGAALAVLGFVLGPRVLWEVGIAVLLIGGGPAVIGGALTGSSAVSRWASRHKLFA
jgi:hypothetical protein